MSSADDQRRRAIAEGKITAAAVGPLFATARRVDRLQLRWTDDTGRARDAIVTDRATVGSARALAVCVEGKTVSRVHAELTPRNDGWWIRDLGSRNGTYVEGLRVESVRLREGSRISLGETVVTARGVDADGEVPLWKEAQFGPLLGQSPPMRELFQTLSRAAATPYPVLIEAETGTGKELVARALHEASPARSGPFVVVDCAALPPTLAEAELFGHARGAYTGASGERAGAIESADGGTVFIDEIGELPLTMQPMLLRALERSEVRRLGEIDYRKVNTRFVAATHRDLRVMVNEDRFREDLYFRMAVVQLQIPPLRERRDDVPLLIEHLLPQGAPRLDASLVTELVKREWPGNVRQLRNFLQRVHALGAERAMAMSRLEEAPAARTIDPRVKYAEARERWMKLFDREYLTKAIALFGRDTKVLAEACGLSATYMRQLLRENGLGTNRGE